MKTCNRIIWNINRYSLSIEKIERISHKKFILVISIFSVFYFSLFGSNTPNLSEYLYTPTIDNYYQPIDLFANNENNSPLPPNSFQSGTFIEEQKSAKLAMLMSAIVPGSGQFYINKRTPTAYIFPVIEIGLWYLRDFFIKQGDNKTKEYEWFADIHYDFHRQEKVQRNLLLNENSGSFYGKIDNPYDIPVNWGHGGHFRLDNYYYNDRQQYYEAIGKYDRYIYGWSDWYETYVRDIDGVNVLVYWIFNDATNPHDIRWIGNSPIDNPDRIDLIESTEASGSPLRGIYIKMRDDAEIYYDQSRTVNFVILANHFASVLDARWHAKKHNEQQMRSVSLSPQINTTYISDKPVPILGLNLSF
ncbi:MAG: hypothetical protein FWG98_11520 [Candidatus Cloacimonetes bacterium]|nr:hypothetical protein [Candidatus Cloacimonadota bacterium]